MPYDLDSLMRNLGPGVGAQWAGQNEALSQNKQGLDNLFTQGQIEAQNQTNALNSQMNPFKVKKAELENQGLEAELPGKTATSELNRIKARQAAATEDSDVAAHIGKNTAEMDKQKYEKSLRIADVFNKSGVYLENQPAPLRLGMLQKMLQEAGADANSEQGKMFMQMAEQAGGEALPGLVKQFAQKMSDQATQLSPAYRQAIDVANISGNKTMEAARIHAGATVQAANIQAEARKAATAAKGGVKSVLDGVASGKIGYEKAATYFTFKAMEAEDDDERTKYEGYAAKFEQANKDQKNASAQGKVDTGAATGLPTQQIPSALTSQPPAAKPPAIKSVADLSVMYPGVPPEKLKELYKKKFGVDLK